MLFDVERITLDDLISALLKIAPNCQYDDDSADIVYARLKEVGIDADRSKIARACRILNCLKRMGLEMFINPIPMPNGDDALKVLMNSDIEVISNKRSDISAEVLAVLSHFCRTLRQPFKIVDVHTFDGFRIIFGEMLCEKV